MLSIVLHENLMGDERKKQLINDDTETIINNLIHSWLKVAY